MKQGGLKCSGYKGGRVEEGVKGRITNSEDFSKKPLET